MDVPSAVLVHNEILGMKSSPATLLTVGDGFYELNAQFGQGVHRVLVPIASTVLVHQKAEEEFETDDDDIER